MPNESRKLKAGSFVKASITTDAAAGALTVPQEALVTFAGVTKVFLVEGGKARAVSVQPGAAVESSAGGPVWVEVPGDLKPGDLVVTSGHSKLADGTPVRIRESSPNRNEAADADDGNQL